jgi:hypothetical protein
MGGLLHLPQYDGFHDTAIQGLVRKMHLVKKQSLAETKFDPPFKKGSYRGAEKSWFLNWQAYLNQPKQAVDDSIEAWWSQILPGGQNTKAEVVARKKKNTIVFADYCRALSHAANLISSFGSGIVVPPPGPTAP